MMNVFLKFYIVLTIFLWLMKLDCVCSLCSFWPKQVWEFGLWLNLWFCYLLGRAEFGNRLVSFWLCRFAICFGLTCHFVTKQASGL